MNGDELRRIEDKLDDLIIKVTQHLADDLDKAISKMGRRGCHNFETKSKD